MTTKNLFKVGWQIVVEPMPFNGVPYDLVKAVHRYHTGWKNLPGWAKHAFTPGMFTVKILNDNPDENRDITAEIESDDDRIAIITVSRHQTGEVLLYVESSEQDWAILEESWLAFRDFLEQGEWIGATPTASAPTIAAQGDPNGVSTRGMSDYRRKRADTFRKIKDANARLSYIQVAMKARKLGYADATEDDVRNDYRAMNWEWERADKVR